MIRCAELGTSPVEYEANVFWDFSSKLMFLQKKHHKAYHDEQTLRDRMLTASVVTSIEVSLRDLITGIYKQTL